MVQLCLCGRHIAAGEDVAFGVAQYRVLKRLNLRGIDELLQGFEVHDTSHMQRNGPVGVQHRHVHGDGGLTVGTDEVVRHHWRLGGLGLLEIRPR